MFFKSFKNGWKANAFVSQLEFAQQRYNPENLDLVRHHLGEARTALDYLRKSGAEDYISKVGWEYVAGIAELLSLNLEVYQLTDLLEKANYISDFARHKAATSKVT